MDTPKTELIRIVGSQLYDFSRELAARHADSDSPHGVTNAQGQIVVCIAKTPGVGIKEVASRLNITSSAVTQLVDGLVRNGLITREQDSRDRRALRLALTRQGIAECRRFEQMRADRASELLASLSDDDLTTLERLLAQVLGQLRSS